MEKILRYLNNFFYKFKETGTFTISNQFIEGEKGEYKAGQYIQIEGSTLNNGVFHVHSYQGGKILVPEVVDEVFTGVIYSLAIPKNVIDLEAKITQFEVTNKPSTMQSESFGNYSYSKGRNNSGNTSTWKDVFAEDLKPYRKIFDGKREVKEYGK